MRLWFGIVCIAVLATNTRVFAQFHEDSSKNNDFAEFENFEDDKPSEESMEDGFEHSKDSDVIQDFEEDDVLIIDEDSKFDHFQDEEEFEGLHATGSGSDLRSDEPSTLKITIFPEHLLAEWHSFYLEILMIAGLLVYFINYVIGQSKNEHIAEVWLADHKQLLLDNFSLVGDTGKSKNEDTSSNALIKESCSEYAVYCSGRVGCDSMLIELKLVKRHDLVAVLAQLVRPQNDQAHIRVELAKDEIDNFVLAIATKKTALHLVRDMADISMYCPEKRPGEKLGLPPGFYVMSEIAEATSAILDTKVLQAFTKFSSYIDYIHISDQFSGPKRIEETIQLTMPKVNRVLLVGLNISIKGRISTSEQEKLKPLLQLTFYLLDKLRRFKLSKEGKSKADKNRLRAEEAFLKTTHVARAEAAAQRREERRRAEKERILQEEDPDKQRKWEEKEQRRLAKKRAPRMKQLKVKAL